MTHPSDKPQSYGLPKEGDVVDAQFVIERVLGVGGMGGVFAARDVRNNRLVALKMILPHLARDAQLVARFLREAKTMASLRSEHVARVFVVGCTAEGSPYMVMELLEGEDLQEHIRAHPQMPLAEVVRCVIEACDAIAGAHQRGVVHRDLKPSNLFLAKQPGSPPKVKLLDFGISKQISLDALPGAPATQLTDTDAVLGSPLYMAPEQLRSSKHVDRRADIWALGVILHKCITGDLPFSADSLGAYFCAVAAEPPKPLRQDRPDAPAELERVVLRCLQRDLSLRFQNVGQLALALLPFAPPDAEEVVERIVGVVGRDASTEPLPTLPALPDDHASPIDSMGRAPSTIAGAAPAEVTNMDATTVRWQPSAARPRQLQQWILAVTLGAGILVAAGVGVQRVQHAQSAQQMPTGSERVIPTAVSTATAASSTAPALPSEVEPKGAMVELPEASASAKAAPPPRRAPPSRPAPAASPSASSAGPPAATAPVTRVRGTLETQL